MDKRLTIAVLVAAVVFGSAGFGGGVMLGRANAGGRVARLGAQGVGPGGQGQMLRGGPAGTGRVLGGGVAVGKVTEKDDNSFTVKMADGSTKTVYFSSSTTFQTFSESSAKDLSIDSTVTAMGQATDGGDITAQRVTVGDAGLGGPGGRGIMRGAQQ